MNTTQSIIVYRNPAEAAFWESGLAFPLFGSLLTFLVLTVVLGSVFENLARRFLSRSQHYWTIRKYLSHAVVVVAVVSAVVVFNYLAI